MSDHLVVVGNGMVGQRLVEALRDRDRDHERRWRVTVLAEEPRRAYDRVNLSAYFDGAAPPDLDLVPDGCYGDGCELHLGETVTAIDRAARRITTSRGRNIRYDALVLATGSSPFVPPVPGADLPGCFVYRTLISRDSARLLANLADGTELDLDVVVFAAGIRPRDELARQAGLAVGLRGGIVVDDGCRTSDLAIYAVGECACAGGKVYGLVAPGYAMAEVAADRLTGGAATFAGADTATKLKLLGVDVASFGDALATTAGALEVTVNNSVAGSYSKLVVSGDAKTLLGGVLVGDTSRYGLLNPLVGRPLPGDPVTMMTPAGDSTAKMELPGDAQVCSCYRVVRLVRRPSGRW